MHLRYWVAILLTMVCYRTACAQSEMVKEGKPLPVISATAASGMWLQRAAFDSNTYGKVRGVSPATSEEPKIVLYTTTLSKEFFNIALAVDNYLADHPELEWSFVQVQDQKGAQAGGYTAEELRTRLDQIQGLVKQNGIKHLSFLVAAPGSNSAEADTNVIVAHVRPLAPGPPVADWVANTPINELQGVQLSNSMQSLDSTILIKDNATPLIFSVVRIKAGETGSLEMALPVGEFGFGGAHGRNSLHVRRANQTVGGKPTVMGFGNATLPGVPGLDITWENDQPIIKFHAHPDAVPGTYDLVFTYQPFSNLGPFITRVRVVISSDADGKGKKL